MEAIAQLITSVGFPIASCVFMFYLLHREQENHREESEAFIKAIDNNTAAIGKLMDRLEMMNK